MSWLDGAVAAWQPGRGVYGSNLYGTLAATLPRRAQMQMGATRVVRLTLPDGPQQVMCQYLDSASIAALGELGTLTDGVSPSIAWFGAAYIVAAQLVRAGRMLPTLTDDGGLWRASWQMLRSDAAEIDDLLGAAMPPAVVAGNPEQPDVSVEVVNTFVDSLARSDLQYSGWRIDVADTRRPMARALRHVAKALSTPDSTFRLEGELHEAAQRLAVLLDEAHRRASGEPILRARLRLALPEEPDGAWPLRLEVFDTDNRQRWCARADAELLTPLAYELVADDRHIRVLTTCIDLAIANLRRNAIWLADWLEDPDRGIDLDAAAATLEALDTLTDLGIEVIAPDSLARRRPSAKGVAQPQGAGSGKFNAKAIVSWQMVVDDTPIDEKSLQRAAESGANLIEIGGRWIQIDRAEARRALANLAEHRQQHGEMSTLELVRLASELDAAETAAAVDAMFDVDGSASESVIHADGWLGELLGGLPDATLHDGVPPPGFTAILRPYQLRGLGWLQFLRTVGLGGCLADDMGLGKTPTTLAHLAGLDGPHLVICPLSVVHNWESEAARFTPLMRVMVHHGSTRSDAEMFTHAVAANDIVLTTYHIATRDIDVLEQVRWSTVVLDEAQAIKNPETAMAKAIRRLPAEQHLALTGTPVENRLSELWSIMSVVTPGLLGNQTQFRKQYGAPIERDHDLVAAAALRQMTSPFLLRRTKADRSLVPDLPDKVEQVAWATLTREQASMYQGVVDQLLRDAEQETGMRRRGLVLAAITRLKQICNHPAHALGDGSRLSGRSGKLARLDELLADLHDAGEQALIFTQFRQMGLLLQEHLGQRFGEQVPFLHGGVSKTGRQKMVQAFQSGDAPSPLLIVSLKAGGTGLNLTAASRVVHYDRWWNPAVEDQATDRAWRIGQQRSVFVHKLVCQGTIEERVDGLINDKRALADAVIGTTGETWLSELSTDDLRDLVVLDQRTVRPV